MPIYEYKCPKCEKIFEKLCLSAGRETSHAACPHCGSLESARIQSRLGFVHREGGSAGGSTCGNRSTGFS